MNQYNLSKGKQQKKVNLILTPLKLETSLYVKNQYFENSSYYQRSSPRTILPQFTPQKKKAQISFQESKNSPQSSLITSFKVRPRNFHQEKVQFQNNLIKVQSRLIPDDSFRFKAKYAVRTRKGVQLGNASKVNQDAYVCCAKIENNECIHLFAICDGHGELGHLVSGLIKTQLPILVSKNKMMLERNSSQGLMIIIQGLSDMLQQSHIDISFSGSTLVIVYVQNNKIYCANLGDSRAILLSREDKWKMKPLSRDHKPSCKDEADRILANGGRIDPLMNSLGLFVGPLRVWTNQNVPGLAMTRSLGDEIAHSVGVSDKPEILQFDLERSDKVIVLGSDGLFEFLSDDQIINCISPYYDTSNIEGACNQLLLSACNSWMQKCNSLIDDITFIVLFLTY
ncbi:unnamed protein product (macronuclear) [Paramecium tetraurelia]|uniref:PPM-type phosphatase domain-containing protein n=1 Tax=Paramecium tetraurelia TaxID=5888 RepID=A0BQU5_PARTE|nr:uncharacterized protein GSPATT00031141001 [Paramecium tetraurelia]CAK60912.1 unnamed protein product [Paramecium tetraurelia]|eukprot:XP_001428310.1 hypothetical protein (macronuclear) [Paramecium tetraurelia strain d4-2]